MEGCGCGGWLPSRKLTYHPKMAYLKMIFLFPRWDMLISRRVYVDGFRKIWRKTNGKQMKPYETWDILQLVSRISEPSIVLNIQGPSPFFKDATPTGR